MVLHALSLRIRIACTLVLAVIAGCTTPPAFEHTTPESRTVPDVKDLVAHLQCELWRLFDESRPDPALDRLRSGQHVAFISLTLDVTERLGLTPSLSFIQPLSDATKRVFDVKPSVAGEAHREITQTFTLVLDQSYKDLPGYTARVKACESAQQRRGLRGDLKLRDIVVAGLTQQTQDDFMFRVVDPKNDSQGATLDALGGHAAPTFGGTLDFTLVYGIDGGPTWTLTHFEGPGSLFTAARTVKDSLVIGIARVTEPDRAVVFVPPGVLLSIPLATSSDDSRLLQASRAAQDHVSRTLLQQLLVRR